ncbi:aldo/keto reductase [Alkalinema pantanalense CENA528]|uniref:aldo/keto reductase n=1 Tax=Alkalinema pantanalense TaxID=1620705 RepID=UPI003D6E3256
MTTLSLSPTLPPIAPLGIGTWAWGDSLFWSYGKDYGAEQVEAAFFAAIEAGITLFDTAEVYGLGESERLLGRFMQQTRQPIFLATKYMPVPWRFSPNQVRDAVKASLDRLQRDRIELYQIHQPVSFLISQQTLLDTLAEEVQAGRIAALGISNYSAPQMRQAHKILADRGIPLAVNQVPYSLLDRKIETNGVMETAKELGVTILAYSPLAQGLLTGKYSPETAQNSVMGARRLDPRFNTKGLQKIQPLVKLLQRIGENYDCTPAQVALNWLMAQGAVVPIPGAKTANQAQQNAGALGWTVTPEEITQIDLMTRSWR